MYIAASISKPVTVILMTVFVSTQWSGAPLCLRAVYFMTGFAVENPSVKNILFRKFPCLVQTASFGFNFNLNPSLSTH